VWVLGFNPNIPHGFKAVVRQGVVASIPNQNEFIITYYGGGPGDSGAPVVAFDNQKSQFVLLGVLWGGAEKNNSERFAYVSGGFYLKQLTQNNMTKLNLKHFIKDLTDQQKALQDKINRFKAIVEQ